MATHRPAPQPPPPSGGSQAPPPQTETFTISGTDTAVPPGGTVTILALSDSDFSVFTLGSTTIKPDGSYALTTTVPVSDVSFATFLQASDGTNQVIAGLGGSNSDGGFSLSDSETINSGGGTVPPPIGGLKTDLQTLIADFLKHAGASTLKTDLTTVLTDIKNQNFGGVDPKAITAAATSFIDSHPTIIAGHS